jgi:hypothetical protein
MLQRKARCNINGTFSLRRNNGPRVLSCLSLTTTVPVGYCNCSFGTILLDSNTMFNQQVGTKNELNGQCAVRFPQNLGLHKTILYAHLL